MEGYRPPRLMEAHIPALLLCLLAGSPTATARTQPPQLGLVVGPPVYTHRVNSSRGLLVRRGEPTQSAPEHAATNSLTSTKWWKHHEGEGSTLDHYVEESEELMEKHNEETVDFFKEMFPSKSSKDATTIPSSTPNEGNEPMDGESSSSSPTRLLTLHSQSHKDNYNEVKVGPAINEVTIMTKVREVVVWSGKQTWTIIFLLCPSKVEILMCF